MKIERERKRKRKAFQTIPRLVEGNGREQGASACPGTAADLLSIQSRAGTDSSFRAFAEMFALLLDANSYVNTINTWAEPHNANGVTPNSIIDSNDEPPCNNQQRMIQRGY